MKSYWLNLSKAFMIAYGTNAQVHREILGFGVYQNESGATWTGFLMELKKRGLTGLLMITSGAHEGILNAIGRVFSTVPWQCCQFHFIRNITDKAPKKYQAGLRSELQEMFNCKSIGEARKIRDRIAEEYRDVAESAVTCLDEGFESSKTVMLFSVGLQKYSRASNHIERLNKELKRHSKVIGALPNEDSVLRIVGSVLIELHDAVLIGRVVFDRDSLSALMQSEVLSKLIIIAGEQQLRAA